MQCITKGILKSIKLNWYKLYKKFNKKNPNETDELTIYSNKFNKIKNAA